MAKVKFLSTKKSKIIFVIILIFVLLLAAGLVLKLTDKGMEVELAPVSLRDIDQHYDSAGSISAGSNGKYYAYEGIVPKKVNVKPGDAVCKGDILATFDASALNPLISEKRKAYNEAQKAYTMAISTQKSNEQQAKEIDKQIAALKKQKSKLPKESQTQTPDIDLSTLTPEELAALVAELSSNTNITADDIDAQITMLEARKALIDTDSLDTLNDMYKQSRDAAKEEYDAIVKEKKELEKGWVAEADGKVGDVYLTVGKAYEYVEGDSSGSFDISSLMGGAGSLDVSSIIDSLNISGGVQIKKGIAIDIDYYSGYTIGFTLGKYDIQTVKVGMPATISYTDFTYEGEVSYISAHATTSTDIVSSMMGGSSTQTSNSVAAQVKINNPDENLIVGFDAKVSILTASKKNVLSIPVESITIDEGKMYVFIYDSDKGIAVRREVEVGISSDEYYEVIKGLTENERVILNASKITDGMKVHEGKKS